MIDVQNGGAPMQRRDIKWFKVILNESDKSKSFFQRVRDSSSRWFADLVILAKWGARYPLLPEDDVYVTNAAIYTMFYTDTLSIDTFPYSFTQLSPFTLLFTEAYNKAIIALRVKTYFTTHSSTVDIKDIAIGSHMNVKKLPEQANPVDKTKWLSFFMSPDTIAAAATAYPSTWVNATGNKLANYDADRSTFLDKLSRGEKVDGPTI